MSGKLSEKDASAARVVGWLEGRTSQVTTADLARYLCLRTGDFDPLDTPPEHAYFDRVARELAKRIYGENLK